MTAPPLLIAGGQVLDLENPADNRPENASTLLDILCLSGKIAKIGPPGSLDHHLNQQPDQHPPQRLDATGLLIAPGLIDLHVHLREPGQTWKESIATGTRAAAAGGFTTVCAMPNTVPVTDTAEWVRWVQDPERGAVIRVLPVAAATVNSLGEQPTDYAALREAGAVGVTDDGKPILEDAMMRQVLTLAAHAGLPVTQHAEDTRMTVGASMNAGPLAFRMGLRGMPVEAEARIVERDLDLLRELRTHGLQPRLHVQHISTEAALNAIRRGKRDGLHVTCEVMPHHFVLNENAVEGYDTHAKMNPPLRSESDRAAMLAGLLDGSIDCIATDHAPHAPFEKEQEFERAPNGITGVETAFGLALRVLHREQGLPLARVLALLSSAPARVLGLTGRGTLTLGAWADLVLFDPHATWTFRAAQSLSRSKNTPFDGHTMAGKVHYTLSEGKIAYAANQPPTQTQAQPPTARQ